jgi:hypothetical protein
MCLSGIYNRRLGRDHYRRCYRRLTGLTGMPRLIGLTGLAGMSGLIGLTGLAGVVPARLNAGVLTGLEPAGRQRLGIFLFLYDLFKTVVNIRQLNNPVA